MAVELASAFVSIIPTTKGLQGNLEKELSPLTGVASKAGTDSGKALGSSFTGASGGLKSSVDQAGGHLDNFKTKATGALSSVGISTGMLAAAGGAAIVGFGVHAVSAFTDTAKAALDLSTATGLTIEDASRWAGVADDYEVSTTALQTGLGKIAKTLDDTKWKEFGIATRDAGGEARPVNDILLDTFDKLSGVTNETEKARIGQELFGKGYQSLTPILGHTREEYEKMLGSVEKGQVITAGEAAKAEKMRLAQDALSDAFKEITLTLGGLLAGLSPVIELLAKGITIISDVTGAVTGLFFGVDRSTESFRKFFTEMSRQATIEQMGVQLKKMTEAAGDAGGFIDQLWGFDAGDSKFGLLRQEVEKLAKDSPEALQSVVSGLNDLKSAAEAGDPAAQQLVKDYELTDEHLKELSGTSLPETIDQLNESTAAATAAADQAEYYGSRIAGAAYETEQADKATAAYDARVALLATNAARHLDIIKGKWDALAGDINADKSLINLQTGFADLQTKAEEAYTAASKGTDDAAQKGRDYKSGIDDQKLAVIDYFEQVLKLPPERSTAILALIDQGKFTEAEAALDQLARDRDSFIITYFKTGATSKVFAAGTPSAPAGMALVGEQGPELVRFAGGERVFTASDTRSLLAGNTSLMDSTSAGPSLGAGDTVTLVIEGTPFTAMIKRSNRELAGAISAGRR